MLTRASQQGTPWSGFNGFRGGLGQGAGEATMLDGTTATIQWDSAGGVVGFYRAQADGTTMLYDADGAPVGATASPAPGFLDLFSTLAQTVTRFLGPPTPAVVGAPPSTGLGGLGLGTLLLLGGAVYLLTSRSSSPRRRRRA